MRALSPYKFLVAFLCLVINFSLYAQKREKIPLYTKHKEKVRHIKTNRTLMVTTEEYRDKGDTLFRTSYFIGKIEKITDTHLYLYQASYYSEFQLENTKKSQQLKEQINYYDSIVPIPLSQIKFVQKDNKLERITPVIAIFTALTGSFLAPIIAYDFKNNSFNSEVYGAIAAPSAFISLGALAVGTTFQRRKYLLQPSGND